MSSILRVWGENFDVESYRQQTKFELLKTWFKEQPRLRTKPNGKVNEESGLSINLSGADFSNLDKQISETISFCKINRDALIHLVKYEGIEKAIADFGVEIYPPGWCSFIFEPELMLLLGEIGITLELSVYPTDSEN